MDDWQVTVSHVPYPPGRVGQTHHHAGFVLAYVLEGAVVTEALDVIANGEPKMLEFGVADETAWNVGLSCGGTIRVFVEKVG